MLISILTNINKGDSSKLKHNPDGIIICTCKYGVTLTYFICEPVNMVFISPACPVAGYYGLIWKTKQYKLDCINVPMASHKPSAVLKIQVIAPKMGEENNEI